MTAFFVSLKSAGKTPPSEQNNPFNWREYVQPYAYVKRRATGVNGPATETLCFQEANNPIAKQKDQVAIEKHRAKNSTYRAKKKALRVNANSGIGYKDQAGTDKTNSIRGK